MSRLLDVPAAAHELNVDPSRVRALISAGDLDGEKIGSRWLVDRESVVRRLRTGQAPGRPFAPNNAWGIKFRASGEPADWLDSVAAWRVGQALRLHGILQLSPRLSRRARVSSFRSHPGELAYIRASNNIVRTGISAAGEHGLELVSGDELDLYMREDRVEALVAEHALRPVTLAEANVTLRAVSPDAWHLDGRSVAPIATVALDLADHQNPRLARIGRELLERMVPSHDH